MKLREKGTFLLVLFFVLITPQLSAAEKPEWALVIHGGAGVIKKSKMTPEKEAAFQKDLEAALRRGEAILSKGGSSLDAVEAVIHVLEDSPHFNAGKGSVFTNAGTNELDASIMDGSNLQAGAVAGVKTIKNPISAARMVMEHSPHVMLTGKGAETFAESRDAEMVDPKYFFTQRRWDSLQKAKKKQEAAAETLKKHGTVGCVALDKMGNIAAGTSTGGMTNKRWGRVGDSPIIGAGTYADNRTCGISATGSGEYFIRAAVAHDISALVGYKKMSVADAADEVIQKKLTALGGTGGVIVMDADGNISWSFNTPGMFRGSLKAGGEPIVRMYED